MTTSEITPSRLHALADDAELYGEGCREYARGLRAAAIELEAALEREARLREDTMPMVAIWAGQYAEGRLPPGHLYPAHYDLLASLGARMDDFTRAALGDAS
jgi:hypothetical protein